MVLDHPVELIIKRVGHDGSEIFWPNLPEPKKRRGFSIMEMQEAFHRTRQFIPFFPRWPARPVEGADVKMIMPSDYYKRVCQRRSGVLMNHHHAVAWDGANQMVLDPNGLKYPLVWDNFDVLWMIM